jgi:serine/threonine protein kinase
MMHRDLKSPNVLLSEEGVAKIADVGMVRSQVKDLVTAQPVMTPLWAAPEVRVCCRKILCCGSAASTYGT